MGKALKTKRGQVNQKGQLAVISQERLFYVLKELGFCTHNSNKSNHMIS